MIATQIARKSANRPEQLGGELVFRIRSSNRDERLVHIKAHKCTIGSGPRCTLRLHAPGDGSLHCLIVRGRAGAVVRRWSPDTLLNYRSFEASLLLPGDVLNLGSVVVEILSIGTDLQAERNALAEECETWEEQCSPNSSIEQQNTHSPALIEPEASDCPEQPDVEQQPDRGAESPSFQPLESAAPVHLDDVFSRIGANVESSGDSEERPPREPEPAIPNMIANDPRERPVAESTDGVDHAERHEESIDEYMGRLMQRVRDATVETRTSSYAPPIFGRSSAREIEASAPAVGREESCSEGMLAKPPHRQPAQLPPKASAQDRSINLSALRELANLSAHNAITRYSRRLLLSSLYSKLLVAAVSAVSTLILLWMWNMNRSVEITYYAALVAALAAIYWGVQYALLSGRLMISKSGSLQLKSPSDYGKGASKPHDSHGAADGAEAAAAAPRKVAAAEPSD
ncbi:MAG: hypothetical protein GX594_08455 [Pirellulaceae bacterium]|nr:hypothetical protein [Pirellulaceae bacterium]